MKFTLLAIAAACALLFLNAQLDEADAKQMEQPARPDMRAVAAEARRAIGGDWRLK